MSLTEKGVRIPHPKAQEVLHQLTSNRPASMDRIGGGGSPDSASSDFIIDGERFRVEVTKIQASK